MKNLLLFIVILFTFSCRPEKKPSIHSEASVSPILSYDSSLVKGTVYSDIICRNDNSASYALYLPADYDTAKKFPVLYFFDPHAEGLLPVEKYKELADRFGFIFIGNNNSKNGNTIETNSGYGEKMFEDAQQRLAINKNRIYFSGFSGGAKVAGYIALHNHSVKGIISCGAAMPLSAPVTGQPFMYIGIAGNEDFNYTEMKKQQEDFDNMDVRHELLTFDGKHEWCPVDVMNEAITGMELEAMKKKTIPVSEKLVDEFMEKSERKILLLNKLGKKFELHSHYHKMINFLDGLYDVSGYTKKADELKNSPGYDQEKKMKADAETKEMALKEQYAQLLSENDEDWWNHEIKSINQRIKTGTNKEETLAQKRILNYLSLAAFMYSSNAINQNNNDAAIHFLNIYKIIDPPNPEHAYLLADVYAIKGEYDKSMACLKEAADLGFKDAARLSNDAELNLLKNSDGYSSVIAKINSNMKNK